MVTHSTNTILIDLTLSIRIVFGVDAIDNGSVLDPNKRGTLTYIQKFNKSNGGTMEWLL